MAALVLVTSAAATATLRPVRLPRFGEVTPSRIRHGVIHIPAGHRKGLVTVLVDLRLPPLAARYGRGLYGFAPRRKLSMASSASRAYLARLAREQRVGAARTRRAIPKARIVHRYRIVLDGFALRLPYRDLPALGRVGAVRKIYPSLRYQLDTNESPSVIHADKFWANTGG